MTEEQLQNTTIDNTTYTHNQQGYILRQETTFNNYREIKVYLLCPFPEDPDNYYVKEELTTEYEGQDIIPIAMMKVTTIIIDDSYDVFVERGMDRELYNIKGKPPLAPKLIP